LCRRAAKLLHPCNKPTPWPGNFFSNIDALIGVAGPAVGPAVDNLIATLNKRRSAARSPTTFSAEKNLLSVSPG
jgi:hypothetical protein